MIFKLAEVAEKSGGTATVATKLILGVKFADGWRPSDRKLKPLPPDPVRHHDSAIAREQRRTFIATEWRPKLPRDFRLSFASGREMGPSHASATATVPTLLTAIALPTTAEQRPGRDGLFSTSISNDFVSRPAAIDPKRRGAAPVRRQVAAPRRSGPAAPAKASSRAAGLAVSPDFPPAQTLDTVTEATKGWYGFP